MGDCRRVNMVETKRLFKKFIAYVIVAVMLLSGGGAAQALAASSPLFTDSVFWQDFNSYDSGQMDGLTEECLTAPGGRTILLFTIVKWR